MTSGATQAAAGWPWLHGLDRALTRHRLSAGEWVFALALSFTLLLCLWNGLWLLGEAAVRDCDEARYGVAASEMLHSHSWLVATYAGAEEFWNLKPPLGYWLIELSYLAFGENPFALRVPAVLCALASVAATMLYARRQFGVCVAVVAGLALATAAGLFGHHAARSGDLDSEITLLLTLALFPALTLTTSVRSRTAMGVLLALGFLVKSFEILPYVLALIVFGASRHGWAGVRAWWRPALIVGGTVATWALARSLAQGSTQFVWRMFVEDLLLRTTSVIDPGQDNRPWDYVAGLADRFAPWPLLLVVALWYVLRRTPGWRPGPAVALLATYTLVPVIAFSLARTHHFQYVLPTLPALAILTGLAARTLYRALVPQRRGALLLAGLCVVLAGCEARVVVHSLRDTRPPAQAFLSALPGAGASLAGEVALSFTPSHSERFLLQVVDGLTLCEPGAACADASAPLLGHLAAPDTVARSAYPPGGAPLAAGAGYALYRRPAVAMQRASLRAAGSR